jgi:hypothetical protein
MHKHTVLTCFFVHLYNFNLGPNIMHFYITHYDWQKHLRNAHNFRKDYK